MSDDPAQIVRVLLDRQQIADLCVRYTTALDTRDWNVLRSCFVERPVFVHPGGRLSGWDAILARTSAALSTLDVTQHLLGNITAEVDGDTAHSRCYFQAQHVRHDTPGGDTYTIAGSYADRLERTAAGWQIAERVQTYSWREGNREVIQR